MQNQQVQNNINLPWIVKRQQNKFMLVLQEVCTLCLKLDGHLDQKSLLRKDFKIRGIIGNSGQKDRISFISLTNQINDGRTAGYSDNEIVGGVLKAMSTNLCLINVLETMECLTLDSLLRSLQAHLEEGNAPDLWSQLTSMAQLFDETAYHFVMRCLETHHKDIVASKQTDDITYNFFKNSGKRHINSIRT